MDWKFRTVPGDVQEEFHTVVCLPSMGARWRNSNKCVTEDIDESADDVLVDISEFSALLSSVIVMEHC